MEDMVQFEPLLSVFEIGKSGTICLGFARFAVFSTEMFLSQVSVATIMLSQPEWFSMSKVISTPPYANEVCTIV